MTGHTATAEVDISASPSQVWDALTDPAQIEKYMFGSQVETTWEPGSPITWKGEFEGKPYEDKGKVLEVEPQRRLHVTHQDHDVVYELDEQGDSVHLSLKQDNASSPEEAEQSAENWQMMLDGLKKLVEAGE